MIDKQEFHSDFLKHFPDFAGRCDFPDIVPTIDRPLLIIWDFKLSREDNLGVSFAFEKDNPFNSNKCWLTEPPSRVCGLNYQNSQFTYGERDFYFYSVQLVCQNADDTPAQKIKSICTDICCGNIKR